MQDLQPYTGTAQDSQDGSSQFDRFTAPRVDWDILSMPHRLSPQLLAQVWGFEEQVPEARPGPNMTQLWVSQGASKWHWKQQQSEDLDLTLEEETNKLDQDGPGIGMESLL